MNAITRTPPIRRRRCAQDVRVWHAIGAIEYRLAAIAHAAEQGDYAGREGELRKALCRVLWDLRTPVPRR
jgi:hypothetical protein